ncbi:MAG: ATP-binding cassette domain-containing protein [Nanoarchaeota archaeon]|nr:ATP-binding cassette domain-containing protein [Nanoarchaeota archaeon]
MKIIEIKDLKKTFGKFVAVDSINLEIEEGEIFGLLGPNGAGKTTTIRMLATMLHKTSGEARVYGIDVTNDPDCVRRVIGIVFQDPAIDVELTGRENLDFHARMYGMAKKEREERIKQVLKMVELHDKADKFVSTYSGGMKRRLEIARGLMHNPKVLFLDEPTLGLDAQTRRVIWEHIKQINKTENVTIILTTHYMDEADYLCNRVAIIDHGKILKIGTAEELKNSIGSDLILIKSHNLRKLKSEISKFKWVIKTEIIADTLRITLKNGNTKIPDIIKTSEKLNVKVDSIELHKPTLEDVFIRFTGRHMREEADVMADNRMRNKLRGGRT